MGLISIVTKGSFGTNERVFSAQQHGHAYAVNEAQDYLSNLMVKSINKDHDLHDQNCKPDQGFTIEK